MNNSLDSYFHFLEFYSKIIFKKKINIIRFLKIMLKLLLKTVIDHYSFNFKFKTVVNNYGFNLKIKK